MQIKKNILPSTPHKYGVYVSDTSSQYRNMTETLNYEVA
jgi:hypothetical protein